MKNRPILFIAIALTLIIELVIIILVYREVGAERLPKQIVRLLFQLVLIGFIFADKQSKALFILSGYHVVSGLMHWFSLERSGSIGYFLMIFHIVVAIVIYLHDWFEMKLGLAKAEDLENETERVRDDR